MATVTKRELVLSLAARSGLTQQQVMDVVQGMLDGIAARLEEGDEVVFRNFGTFKLQRTKPRIGRNPARPGTDAPIPERTVVRFKPGKELQERVKDSWPTA
jgi:nucleoid DNA-binding protein